MKIKAVFFDIDGTLVDSNDFHVDAWEEAIRDEGAFADRSVIRAQIGKGGDTMLPSLFPDMPEESRNRLSKRHGTIFRERYLNQVKPLPGVTELLELLHHRGCKIVLASSAEAAEVAHYRELLKIQSLVDGSISKDDVEVSKPAGDIFAAALELVFPLNASEVVAVGDTAYDIEAAKKNSVRTIAVRSGGGSEDSLWDAGAVAVYASVKDLLENIDKSVMSEH